jgi:hypothetical protein
LIHHDGIDRSRGKIYSGGQERKGENAHHCSYNAWAVSLGSWGRHGRRRRRARASQRGTWRCPSLPTENNISNQQ